PPPGPHLYPLLRSRSPPMAIRLTPPVSPIHLATTVLRMSVVPRGQRESFVTSPAAFAVPRGSSSASSRPGGALARADDPDGFCADRRKCSSAPSRHIDDHVVQCAHGSPSSRGRGGPSGRGLREGLGARRTVAGRRGPRRGVRVRPDD